MNDVFCDTLRARFESALSKVHFLCSSEEMSNYKALNDNFLHGPNLEGLELNDDFLHNPGVLEYAIINDNVDLLKYASDLGLAKADISEDVFEKAIEEGSKEVLEYFISVFQTIDYTGIFYLQIHAYCLVAKLPSSIYKNPSKKEFLKCV